MNESQAGRQPTDPGGPGEATAETRLAAAETELDELRSRVSNAEDLRLRALADLDNLRKRCATQVGKAAEDSRAQVAGEWLPVVDNLERALEYAQADPDSIIEGIQTVRDQALRLLASLGYPRREDIGARFDPARHDAVAVQSSPDAAAGTVIEVLQPGYGDDEHQLRPAQVVVAKAD